MSKIAEALAKAKERTGHTTAPFLTGAQVAPPNIAISDEEVRRARVRHRFWLVLSSVALVATCALLWFQLFAGSPAPVITAPAPAVVATKSAAVAKPVTDAPAPAPVAEPDIDPAVLPSSKVEIPNLPPAQIVRPSKAGEAEATPAPVSAPGTATAGSDTPVSAPAPVAPPPVPARPELQLQVNSFRVTALIPGERPKLMMGGRVFAVGDRVEGELIFAGVQDGAVIFNDARGAIYLRRY